MRFWDYIFKYLALFALGIILFIALRPYAMAHRMDPSLFGGEVLLVFAPMAIGAIIDTIKHNK